MIDALFGSTVQILEKSMELRMARQSYLAANIANAETPNYRAVDIDFQATMEQLIQKREDGHPRIELTKTDPRHLSIGQIDNPRQDRPHLVFAAGDDVSIGNDNNSVNLEEQLGRLQANTMLYGAMTQILNKKIDGLKAVIESGSRL
ncbi:flagellar basal body rod protein FlgB [bacterium]|nr:flagellar basal body rod protein FlgB [bacterium]